MNNKKGFTLIELVLVIMLLGILAVSAMPYFYSMAREAESSARDGVIGAVRSALAIYRANDMIDSGGASFYPSSLDDVTDGDDCSYGCFSQILASPINDTSWTKIDSTRYLFNDGVSAVEYTYDAISGTFQ